MDERENLCAGCAYGRRYVDLGTCPECGRGRLTGDLLTRDIACTMQHTLGIAIDFTARQNCYDLVTVRDFRIVVTGGISRYRLQYLSEWLGQPRIRIYQAVFGGQPLFTGMDLYAALRTGKRLHDAGIAFETIPALPVLPHFCACFPHLETDYAWVLGD